MYININKEREDNDEKGKNYSNFCSNNSSCYSNSICEKATYSEIFA